ncbi:Dbl homology domain-containing protein [Gonapodya prolifera JEL478]|uniref:Dbl homology domain-containing protein n=1 Tax=Gonapodya prolifera (strain JEL478) TaxID=1344416 RepID=A0A139AEC0_GONPJ|nr:Dbl homology domain-containing protein [Gonapodya prolifera JEL478]|eukprot:KXS15166.1 Dbl homology domain-containing protein [Gonapodya prolifera JEL478]
MKKTAASQRASPSPTLVESNFSTFEPEPDEGDSTEFEVTNDGIEAVLTESAETYPAHTDFSEAEEWIRRSLQPEEESVESDGASTISSRSVEYPHCRRRRRVPDQKDIMASNWRDSVPSHVTDGLPPSEMVRQEAIFELVKIQCEFAADLRNMCKYIETLRQADTMDPHRLQAFIRVAFANMDGDMMHENAALAELLKKRQKERPIVEHVGDVLLSKTGIKALRSFAQYGKNQFYSQWWVKNEKSQNPAFATFVEAQSRLPQYRRLPLEAFITRPSTHLGRLPLLADVILQRTPADSPDQLDLQAYMRQCRSVLKQIDSEVAKVNTTSTQRLAQPAEQRVPSSAPAPATTTRAGGESRLRFAVFRSPTR